MRWVQQAFPSLSTPRLHDLAGLNSCFVTVNPSTRCLVHLPIPLVPSPAGSVHGGRLPASSDPLLLPLSSSQARSHAGGRLWPAAGPAAAAAANHGERLRALDVASVGWALILRASWHPTSFLASHLQSGLDVPHQCLETPLHVRCTGRRLWALHLCLVQGGAECPKLPFGLCPRLWNEEHTPDHEEDDISIYGKGAAVRAPLSLSLSPHSPLLRASPLQEKHHHHHTHSYMRTNTPTTKPAGSSAADCALLL